MHPTRRQMKKQKKAEQGDSSDTKSLPKFLPKCLSLSISVLHQDHISKLKKCWGKKWKNLPRTRLLNSIDNSALSKKYIRLITGLNHRQVSILFQLCTGHVGLNQDLFCIRKSKTPVCPNCQDLLVGELVKHFHSGMSTVLAGTTYA